MNFCGVYIRPSVSWGYDDKRPAAYNIFPAPAELLFPHLECQICTDRLASLDGGAAAAAGRPVGRGLIPLFFAFIAVWECTVARKHPTAIQQS